MFKKILIANRGEIALRIIRACRELGVRSVAVHSTADADALHVRFADESICIGPPPSKQSYLKFDSLIAAAEVTRADAIHPGYGFLAENADFADACIACGLQWVGPPPALMRLMGDKDRARMAMRKAEVPILPGTGLLPSVEEAVRQADEIGYPVIIKATAGGGGRGMKIIRAAEEIGTQFHTARREAEAAFGNPEVYLERYLERPRHVEVQVACDDHGGVAILGERECSIQRRHQKLVEEAPSIALTEKQRTRLHDVAHQACQLIGYRNVGTMEFLLDDRGRFYFMEMNTRIQVEHTVTEMVTSVDLVREQIQLACGAPLSVRRAFVPRGHSIECRINAEDSETFAPSPGKITALHLPGGLGVRVDTHIYEQYVVPPFYDSLLAKLIVHAEDREHAIARMRSALGEFVIEGIKSTLGFHRRLFADPDFQAGNMDTGFVARFLEKPRE